MEKQLTSARDAESGKQAGQNKGIDLDLLFDAPQNVEVNYFDLLGVSPMASDSEIRNAYIRQKQQAQAHQAEHNHLFMSGPSVRQYLDQLEEAYRVLSNRTSREHYMLGQLQQPQVKKPGPSAFKDPTPAAVANLRPGPVDRELHQSEIRAMIESCERVDGVLLKRIREHSQVSLQQLHSVTKVNIEFLRALEDGAFEALPEVVYVKGFLRAILKYLQVDQAEFIIQELMKPILHWKSSRKIS